jgi:hypothetical protein
MTSMNVSSCFERPLSDPWLAIEYPALQIVDTVRLSAQRILAREGSRFAEGFSPNPFQTIKILPSKF